MELIISVAAGLTTSTNLHLPHRPTTVPNKTPVFILSVKNPCRISSNSFPKLTATARTTVFSAHASLLETSTVAALAAAAPSSSTRWMVLMERPPNAEALSRAEVIDYYVETLARVLPSEKEAQMCICRASWESDFFFCCDIDDDSSRELARIPGVISIRPDRDIETVVENYSSTNLLLAQQFNSNNRASRFFPSVGNCDYWLVKIEKPGVEVVTRAQMVDYFALILTKVMGNEKDAQVSLYHISWEKDFGFCCQIDEECARELSDVPGVLSVQTDVNFESENKNYRVDDIPPKTGELHNSSKTSALPDIKTKRLFVTGLSFYTSEKTLRASFEPFGELVEVKIIMDKISKRSKGYAFIEYTTEEAAGAALKEMNGKIINGWMIVVDVAKTSPPKYNRGHQRPPSSSSSFSRY